MENIINIPTQSSYVFELMIKKEELVRELSSQFYLNEVNSFRDGFGKMLDYFIEEPTNSLKDLDLYRKTILRGDFSNFRDLGTKEFIKEVYNMREKNKIYQKTNDLEYLTDL